MPGSSYIRLPKELGHSRKGLINIKNIDDNECFKWSLFRYLNPADHHPTRITKADKYFAKKFDFKDIKCPEKLETFTKFKKKRISSTLAFFFFVFLFLFCFFVFFSVMKIRKSIQFMYQQNAVKIYY